MSAANPHKPNSGTLFPNSEKFLAEGRAKGKDRPQMGGEVNILCPCCQQETRFRVSAWSKTGRESGQAFLSLAFAEPEDKEGGTR